jgi:hypothetical protein
MIPVVTYQSSRRESFASGGGSVQIGQLPLDLRGLVRAEGLEPSRGLRPNGFSYQRRLSSPCRNRVRGTLRQVRGLDYTFTMAVRPAGAARLVSTPSPPGLLRRGLARDRHFTGFPEFEQFCIAGFPASTQVALKSDASADSATPAWPL